MSHSSTHPSNSTDNGGWNLAAAVAGWLLPGLGHFLIGERWRAAVLAITIMTIWTTGLLIGGINVIEYRGVQGQFQPWFLGQMLTGPSLAVDWYHRSLRREHMTQFNHLPEPQDPVIPYQPSYGRTNEQGVLYTALAGMLNLLVIVDVAYRRPIQPDPETDQDDSD